MAREIDESIQSYETQIASLLTSIRISLSDVWRHKGTLDKPSIVLALEQIDKRAYNLTKGLYAPEDSE
jgi:hypothetical protein